MTYYLKFPASTGNTNNNNWLVQVSGCSGTAVISYTLGENLPAFASENIYIFDIRRSLNSTSSSGGTGFLLRNRFGGVDSTATVNHKINGSSVSGANLFDSSPVADDVCEFETSNSINSGVFAFGGRHSQTEGYSNLAIKNIVVTDDNGAHTIDMSDSGGTLSTFDSTDGTITLTLINFPTANNNHWVSYGGGGVSIPVIINHLRNQGIA